EKGYKDGWAYMNCQKFAGRAPRNRRQLGALPPSSDTRNIVKHLMIKAAKSREAQQRRIA
ncbi:hypothetical protein R0J91_21235, partial [Micrococcus sp. SIMBA_131]